MPKWSPVTTAEQLAARIDKMKRCCLKECPDDYNPERIIATHADTDDDTDDSRIVIYQTKFGTFGVYTDSEDYTGHG